MKATAADIGNSRLMTFSIKVGGRWTTVRLERELMLALEDLARGMGLGIHELCTEIALDRPEGSFTSALRVFLVNHYRRVAAANGFRSGPRRVEATASWAGSESSVRRRVIGVGAGDASSELVSLYRWWEEQRPAGDGRVPAHHHLNPDVLRKLRLGGLVHTVDANFADPMSYRFRVFGRTVATVGGRDFAGLRIAEVPGRAYRLAAAEEYYTVVTTGAPRLHEIDASVGNSRRVYQRLILPFSGTGRGPDTLLVAVTYKAPGLGGELVQNLRS